MVLERRGKGGESIAEGGGSVFATNRRSEMLLIGARKSAEESASSREKRGAVLFLERFMYSHDCNI